MWINIYTLLVASLSFGTISLGNLFEGNIRPWELLLGAFLLVTSLKLFVINNAKLTTKTSFLLIAPFIVSIFFSTIVAFSLDLWIKQAALVCAMIILFVVVSQRCSREQLIQNLRWVIYPGIFVAGWGILEIFFRPENLQVYSSDSILLVPRVRSFFAEANEFSQYLSLPFGFLFAAIIYHRSITLWERCIYFLGLFIVIAAQMMSFSRGGLVAFAAELLAWMSLRTLGDSKVKNKKYILLFPLVIVVIIGFLYFTQLFVIDIFDVLGSRITSLFSGNDVTTSIRLESIYTAFNYNIKSVYNFIVGIGFGNLPILLEDKVATTSNFLVDVFSETGSLGLISFSIIIINLLLLPLNTFRLLIKNKDDQLIVVFYGTYLSFIGLIIGGLTAATHMLNFFWFISGMLIALYQYGLNLNKVILSNEKFLVVPEKLNN